MGDGFRVHHLSAGTNKPIYRPASVPVEENWIFFLGKPLSSGFDKSKSSNTSDFSIHRHLLPTTAGKRQAATFYRFPRGPTPVLELPLPRQIQTSLAVSAVTRREPLLLLNPHPESRTRDLFRKTVSSTFNFLHLQPRSDFFLRNKSDITIPGPSSWTI